jgi:hypothetical protein
MEEKRMEDMEEKRVEKKRMEKRRKEKKQERKGGIIRWKDAMMSTMDFILFRVPCCSVAVFNKRQSRILSERRLIFEGSIYLVTHYMRSRDENLSEAYKRWCLMYHSDKNMEEHDDIRLEQVRMAFKYVWVNNIASDEKNWTSYLTLIYNYKMGDMTARELSSALFNFAAATL